jgi:hypothetical protein
VQLAVLRLCPTLSRQLCAVSTVATLGHTGGPSDWSWLIATPLAKAPLFSFIVTPRRNTGTPQVVLLPDELALEEGMVFTHSDSIEVKRVKGKGRTARQLFESWPRLRMLRASPEGGPT